MLPAARARAGAPVEASSACRGYPPCRAIKGLEVANYSILDAHLAQVAGNLELWFGNLLHLLDGHAGGDFLEKQSAGCDFDERMVGHDVMNAAFAGERQRAFAEDLGRPVLIGVLHRHEDAFGAHGEVHRSPHAFDHLSGDQPIGEIPLLAYLHGSQYRHVDVTAADHPERGGGVEKRRAGNRGHRFFAGVDQIGIFLALVRPGSDSEHAVFGVQQDVHARWNVVGHQRRHSNAEVDVEPIAQFLGDSLSDSFARQWHVTPSSERSASRSTSDSRAPALPGEQRPRKGAPHPDPGPPLPPGVPPRRSWFSPPCTSGERSSLPSLERSSFPNGRPTRRARWRIPPSAEARKRIPPRRWCGLPCPWPPECRPRSGCRSHPDRSLRLESVPPACLAG